MNGQITNLQEEVNTLRAEVVQQKQYIRQLEQTNDDLERSNRNALASVEDIENRLNQVLEKNALLEVELYEKEELNVYVQRLKDEVRGKYMVCIYSVLGSQLIGFGMLLSEAMFLIPVLSFGGLIRTPVGFYVACLFSRFESRTKSQISYPSIS